MPGWEMPWHRATARQGHLGISGGGAGGECKKEVDGKQENWEDQK